MKAKINRLHDILKAFDIPSGSLMGLYTVLMMGLTVYLSLTGKAFASGSVAAYGTVVALFAASKGYTSYLGQTKDSRDDK